MRAVRMLVTVTAVGMMLAAPGRGPAAASTVARATLDDLVAEAESIVVAEVVDTRTLWSTSRSEPTIITEVIFSVEKVLKGPPRVQARLEFLGGTVGETRIEVVGVPRFRVGDRDVLFIEGATGRVSALVGLALGRFRLMRDPRTREELVAFHDFRPVTDVNVIGTAAPRAVAGRGVTLRRFEDAVRERVERLAR